MRSTLQIVAGLSDEDMVWLLSIGKFKALKPDDWLVKAGRAVNDLFFVVDGSLDVLIDEARRVATLGAGEVIGEMSFVERSAPSASVRAAERCEVLAIPRRSILDRFEEDSQFAMRFYRALAVVLSVRLRETTAARPGADEDARAQKAEAAAGARFGRLVGKLRIRTG